MISSVCLLKERERECGFCFTFIFNEQKVERKKWGKRKKRSGGIFIVRVEKECVSFSLSSENENLRRKSWPLY